MVNEEIKAKEVRLIMEGKNDVLKLEEALKMAKEEDLDLICINTKSDIPVCKIGDYNKYLYEQKKKEKEMKKKSKMTMVETKEIRISDSIEINDLRTKAKMIDKFLSSKNKVRLVIRYRGRAITHINEGGKKLENLTKLISVPYQVDTPSKILGNQVSMIVAPK